MGDDMFSRVNECFVMFLHPLVLIF